MASAIITVEELEAKTVESTRSASSSSPTLDACSCHTVI